jgi:hypothetical protein
VVQLAERVQRLGEDLLLVILLFLLSLFALALFVFLALLFGARVFLLGLFSVRVREDGELEPVRAQDLAALVLVEELGLALLGGVLRGVGRRGLGGLLGRKVVDVAQLLVVFWLVVLGAAPSFPLLAAGADGVVEELRAGEGAGRGELRRGPGGLRFVFRRELDAAREHLEDVHGERLQCDA